MRTVGTNSSQPDRHPRPRTGPRPRQPSAAASESLCSSSTETNVFNSNLTDRPFHGNPTQFRLSEVAGSSHYDHYGLNIGPTDTGSGRGAIENLAAMRRQGPSSFGCTLPVNSGGTHWVLDAAVHWLNGWLVSGTPPPEALLLATTQVSPVVFAKDADGNTIGGVRSPQVDAPIAELSGQSGSGPSFCFHFGTTVPLSTTHIVSL